MRVIVPLLLALLLPCLPAGADPRLVEIMPELKTLPRPTWVKPGARIVWWSGSNSQTRVGGKAKRQGALGHNVLTIVAVEGKTVAATMRSFHSVRGTEQEAPALSGSSGALINPGGGEYWVHPEALKALTGRAAPQGVKVGQGQKTVNGKPMNVVAIAIDGAFWEFDVASGVLVSMHTYSTADEVRKTQSRVANTMEFRAFEQINYPWMQSTLPAWVQKVQEYVFQAEMVSDSVAGMEPIRQAITVTHTRMGSGATWLFTKHVSKLPAQTADAPSAAFTASGVAALGLCLPPRELAKLTAGTVLARNKFVQSTLSVAFIGEQEGKQVAVLREAAPQFAVDATYDLQSGVLLKTTIRNRLLKTEFRAVLQATK